MANNDFNDVEVQDLSRIFVALAMADPIDGSALLQAAATIHAILASDQDNPEAACDILLAEHSENVRLILSRILSNRRYEA